ncbi:hypothetical protein F2981_21985 (plasmid) [Sinorhizobium meliloti]|nr:hypothetical protein [Sinorhizobium meliloti]
MPKIRKAFRRLQQARTSDRRHGLFAADCVFNAVAGPEACGSAFVGAAAIADALLRCMERQCGMPIGIITATSSNADRRRPRGTFSAPMRTASRIVAEGCDLFTLRDGKIVRKQHSGRTGRSSNRSRDTESLRAGSRHGTPTGQTDRIREALRSDL